MANYKYLLDLEKEEIFSRVTKDSYFWHEIIEKMSFYIQSNYADPQYLKNVFITKDDFQQLEALNIDFNYKDNLGNNFLRFIFENRSHKYIELSFLDKAIEYIIDKIDNIYALNNNDEHLLFSMIEPSNAGLHGEDFFKFINKFPEFDLHQKNRRGQNLLNKAIFSNSDESIINYFIKNNLSIDHIDSNGNNLISNMIFSSYNKQNIDLFDYLFDKNDITIISKFNDNILDLWINQIKRNPEYHGAKQAVKWINHFLKNCAHRQLTPEYKHNIFTYLDKNMSNFYNISEKTTNNAQLAFSTLLSQKIDNELNAKAKSSVYKI